MTGRRLRSVNAALLQRAERLVREFESLPAGSVLRCFARAVSEAKRNGCALADLPDVAETKAHTLLAARARPDQRIPPARSPADR